MESGYTGAVGRIAGDTVKELCLAGMLSHNDLALGGLRDHSARDIE